MAGELPIMPPSISSWLIRCPFSSERLARFKSLEDFIADDSVNVGRFFGRMAKAAPQVHNHFGKVFGKKGPQQGATQRKAEANQVTKNEWNWLDGMIDADGEVDTLEKALLDHLAKDI